MTFSGAKARGPWGRQTVDLVVYRQYRSKMQSSRHISCAAAWEKQSFLRGSGRHSESACYFLNGIAFTAQPEAPASTKAGASGWAVNRNPQVETKSTVC